MPYIIIVSKGSNANTAPTVSAHHRQNSHHTHSKYLCKVYHVAIVNCSTSYLVYRTHCTLDSAIQDYVFIA